MRVLAWVGVAVVVTASGCLEDTYECKDDQVVNASVCTTSEPLEGQSLEFSALSCDCATTTTGCSVEAVDGGFNIAVTGRTCTLKSQGMYPSGQSNGCASQRAVCSAPPSVAGSYRLTVNGAERGSVDVVFRLDAGSPAPIGQACFRTGTLCQ